jgi:tRNA(fMet)-specific endonuclease VapC
MMYLLDTDTSIYIVKKKPESVFRKLRSQGMEQVAVSTITVAELEHGVEKSQQPERNRVALMEFLIPFALIDFDYKAAQAYGRIRAALESKGSPIGPMDLLLAAQALSRDLIFVTNNVREFRRVEGLRVENWAVA